MTSTIDAQRAASSMLPHAEYGSRPNPESTATGQEKPVTKKNLFLSKKPSKQPTENQSASIQMERSFFIGMFNDIVKNLAKILTGSMLTDIQKGLLKNSDQTLDNIIYANFIDSFGSRIGADILGSFGVRFFSGNYKIFGFKIPHLPSVLSSQMFTKPWVLLSRSSTAQENVNRKSAEDNMGPIEKESLENLKKINPWLFRKSKDLQSIFNKHIKPKLNFFFGHIFGIKEGEHLKDKEGNLIYVDSNGNRVYDKKQGRALRANAQVNKKRLGGITLASFFASFLMPHHTRSMGFEEATTPLKALAVTILTTLSRIDTTLSHNGFGMHFGAGKNFDFCYRTAVREKTLVPLVQYSCDSLGTLLSKYLPINGSAIANILRLVAEIPFNFLSTALVNIAKKDRTTDDWKFLAHKTIKPFLDLVENTLKIPFTVWSKNTYGRLGMFDPKVHPKMYDYDIRTEKEKNKEKLSPEIKNKFSSDPLSLTWLLIKKFAGSFKESFIVIKDCLSHSEEFDKKVQNKLAKFNEMIDLRDQASQILSKNGLHDIKLKTENQELNEKIISLAKTNQAKEIPAIVAKAA